MRNCLTSALAKLWTLGDSPHKALQWVFIVLACKTGFALAAGIEAGQSGGTEAARAVFEYVVIVFVVIGGYAKGGELIGKVTEMLLAMRGVKTAAPPSSSGL